MQGLISQVSFIDQHYVAFIPLGGDMIAVLDRPFTREADVADAFIVTMELWPVS